MKRTFFQVFSRIAGRCQALSHRALKRPSHQSNFHRRLPLCAAVVLLTGGRLWADEPKAILECHVIQVNGGEVYIDRGSDSGLNPGDLGTVQRHGSEINRAQIHDVARRSSRSEIIIRDPAHRPRVGDIVVFIVKNNRPADAEKPFVPLLAAKPADTQSSNVIHGRLRFRQLFRRSPDSAYEYDLSKVASDGSIDRLGGQPWSFTWFGEATYRDGPAFLNTPDYRKTRPTLFTAELHRSLSGGGFLRFGRFSSPELAGLGYLDGGQADITVGRRWRVGAVAGLKPDAVNLAFSTRQVTATFYGTVEAGDRARAYYSGTAGVQHTTFDGKLDRRALLVDQQVDLGPRLSLYSSSEVDFKVNAETGPQQTATLTRLNVNAISPIARFLVLRAGYDRSRQLDNRAERDLLASTWTVIPSQVFDRQWVGSTLSLPLRLQLDDEVAFVHTTGQSSTARWRVGLTRTGLPRMDNARVSATAYNVYEAGIHDYAGLLTAMLPCLNRRSMLSLSYGGRLRSGLDGRRTYKSTDYAARLDAYLNETWSVHGSVSHTYAVFGRSDLFDIGIDCRW